MVPWGIHGFKIQIKNNSCFLSFPGLSAVSAMPLFSWMKWSQESRVQVQDEGTPLKTSGVVPSRMLIRELLWHVEERERLARELEREHRLAHSALGLHWFQKYPRFREVLATNNIRPWELASVFKQVLRDFLSQKEYDEEDDLPVQPAQLRPMEAWTSRYKMRQGFVTPTVPNCGDHPREEIPTISGYVDRAMRYSSSFAGSSRDWDRPYYYPIPVRPIEAYSTTL
ncbi:protein RD3-like isoform X3 [Acanthopagrus latus]|uniref:protein RD3-like isoform X3 n=1 Tax=Acanthopagrus latus TaxID=8177 RepID=UPI00187C1542|nr:protein RD3-like isoform X3 [Acanthopagrus latus]